MWVGRDQASKEFLEEPGLLEQRRVDSRCAAKTVPEGLSCARQGGWFSQTLRLGAASPPTPTALCCSVLALLLLCTPSSRKNIFKVYIF